MANYENIPSERLVNLALNGDGDACNELAIRYSEGKRALPKDFVQSEYWKKKALIYGTDYKIVSIVGSEKASKINQETLTAFSEEVWKTTFAGNSNGTDLFVWDIPDEVRYEVRLKFDIHVDETILYVRDTSFWNNRNQGTIVTDWGITCIPDNDERDEKIRFSWEIVESVKYDAQILYFYGYDGGDDYQAIHLFHFLKETDDEAKNREEGERLACIFTKMAKTQIPENNEDNMEKVITQYNGLIDKEQTEEAFLVALQFREVFKNTILTPQVAWGYFHKGQGDKALQILDEDINTLSEECLETKVQLCYNKYSILHELKNDIAAREDCLFVMKNAAHSLKGEDGILIIDNARNDFKKYEDYYVQCFLDQPYNKRKLIVPVKEYTDLSQKQISVVDINNLPSIHFSMGHPIANQLYVGHPYLPARYIPFENYEREFLEDKIREFCQIMQYLGATDINIDSINASANNRNMNYDQKVSGGGSNKTASVQSDFEKKGTNNYLEDISQSINLHQVFKPTSSPVLPENLVWYPNEPSWQRLYAQRMRGGLLQHEERIETRKNQVIENSELKQVSAEFQWLFVKANGKWEQSLEQKFEIHENAILAIHVHFAPLETLQEANNTVEVSRSNLTSAEKEYLEEVEACLEEDGEISPKERRLLNRLRDRLDISESRAIELEVSLQFIQLTDEEKEYLEEYTACVEEDDEISPKERRLLNRLRDKLGITEERAKEIEFNRKLK